MLLTSPIWLILLAPWAGLVVWLLSGRRNKTAVPFLNLWRTNELEIRKPRRAWEKPPVALAALLTGMMLAIFAAAGPIIPLQSLPSAAEESDVTIETLSVRSQSSTQAMVRLLNQSDLSAVTLTAKADGKTVQTQRAQLPGRGQTQNYFLDIAGTPSVVEVELDADEPTGIHDRAQASRRAAWPIVEARSALSPELGRMIEVYARHRPSGEGSTRIAVLKASEGLDLDSPAAFVADEQSGGRKIAQIEPLLVQDGPLTRSVDWVATLSDVSVWPIPPGNWQTVVSVAGVAVVAVRSEPFRQVWIGFDSPDFASRPDFVVFWSNIFNWLGDGEPTYDWVQPLKTPPSSFVPRVRSIAGIVLVSAMGLICFSAAIWRRTGVGTAQTALS
jgi:hypothetical protein